MAIPFSLSACNLNATQVRLSPEDVESHLQAIEKMSPEFAPLVGTVPTQWRVIWTEDPAHRAKVSWTTALAGQTHRVYYDTQSRRSNLEYAYNSDSQRNGAYTKGKDDPADLANAFYHHVRLTNLKPSTTYYFVIQSDSHRSREFHFTTAPEDAKPFSLLYGGDSRTNHTARQQMNRWMATLTEQNPDLIGFVHGGDYIVDGHFWSQWKVWLSHNELCVSPSGRILPIIPTFGNHDRGPIYDEVFDNPGGATRNYYTCSVGNQTTVTILNSEFPLGKKQFNEQLEWMNQTFSKLRPINHWLLASYHAPIYPAVKSPRQAKAQWTPIFEAHNLDLIMESDGHCVKRTVPIRAEKPDPTGVVYIGEGGLGAPQRDPKQDRWYIQSPGFADRGHHIQILDIAPEALRIRVLLIDGKLRDDNTLKLRKDRSKNSETVTP